MTAEKKERRIPILAYVVAVLIIYAGVIGTLIVTGFPVSPQLVAGAAFFAIGVGGCDIYLGLIRNSGSRRELTSQFQTVDSRLVEQFGAVNKRLGKVEENAQSLMDITGALQDKVKAQTDSVAQLGSEVTRLTDEVRRLNEQKRPKKVWEK